MFCSSHETVLSFFLRTRRYPAQLQYCPCRFFLLGRYKLCGHETTTEILHCSAVIRVDYKCCNTYPTQETCPISTDPADCMAPTRQRVSDHTDQGSMKYLDHQVGIDHTDHLRCETLHTSAKSDRDISGQIDPCSL